MLEFRLGVRAAHVTQRARTAAILHRHISVVSAVPLLNSICPVSTVLELFFDQHQF